MKRNLGGGKSWNVEARSYTIISLLSGLSVP